MGNALQVQHMCSGSTIAQKYRQLEALNDVACGELALAEDPLRQSNDLFGIKQILFYDEEACESAKARLLDVRRVHENVLRILEAHYTTQNNLCAKLHRLEYVFEYSQKSLLQDLSFRRICNKPFSEGELWVLLESLLGGAIHLHRIHESNTGNTVRGQPQLPATDIRLHTILVFQPEETLYKLVDPEISRLPRSSELMLLLLQNSTTAGTQGVYLAPEELVSLQKCANSSRQQVSYSTATHLSPAFGAAKSDVFAIGMVMLAAASLDTLDAVYNYGSCTMNAAELSARLTKNVKGKYSEKLFKTVQSMLQLDAQQRPDLMSVAESILLLDRTHIGGMLAPHNNSAKGGLNDVTNLSIKSFDFGGATTAVYLQDEFVEASVHTGERAGDVIDSQKTAADVTPVAAATHSRQASRGVNNAFKGGFQEDKENQPNLRRIVKENPQAVSQFLLQPFKSSFQEEEVVKLLSTHDVKQAREEVVLQAQHLQNVQPKIKAQNLPPQNHNTTVLPQALSPISDQATARKRALQQLSEVQKEIEHLKYRYTNTRGGAPNQQQQQQQQQQVLQAASPNTQNPTPKAPMPSIVAKVSYEDGSCYEGEVLAHPGAQPLRHGKGKLVYSDGAHYIGMWLQNQTSGFGQLFYASGQVAYEGQWKNDKFEGKGAVYKEGCAGLKNGAKSGAVQGASGTSQPIDYRNLRNIEDLWTQYEGEFLQDERNGAGVLLFASGEKFQGTFVSGVPNGQGTFHSKAKGVVQGLWKDGLLTHLLVQNR